MQIVIVGGGFAGVKAALELSRRGADQITLISSETYFLHHATLYATATGKNTAESVLPLRELFAHHPAVRVVHDTITGLDTSRKVVRSAKHHYDYDQLILALGSVTTYFGIKGMAQHAYGIKSLDEIRTFQAHIHNEIVHKRLDRNYFVIGAGGTGVELAGALHEYLQHLKKVHRLPGSNARVTLVEAAPRILPAFSATASRLVMKRLRKIGVKVLVGHKVEALDDTFIKIEGKKVPTQTAIWTSGVANNPFFASHGHDFVLNEKGKVSVDPHLQVHPDVYVLGDNNNVRYSGQAWPALGQAKYAAKRMMKKGRGPAFRPSLPPSGFPVGSGWGYVEYKGIYVAGRVGHWARRLMELYSYTQVTSWPVAVALWRAHDIPEIDENMVKS